MQSFGSDLYRLHGFVIGDRDFDRLVVRGGTQFGLPGPGRAELVRLGPPGSNFNVQGHFDLAYEVEFVGSPHGPLAGRAGTTRGTLRMTIGESPPTSPASTLPLLGAFLGPVALLGLLIASARSVEAATQGRFLG